MIYFYYLLMNNMFFYNVKIAKVMIMDELRKDYMYIVFVKIWELKKNSKFTRSMMRYKKQS